MCAEVQPGRTGGAGGKVVSRKSVLKARRWRGSGEAACLARERERETALLEVRVSIEVQSRIVRLINMGLLPGARRGGRRLGAMACAGCCRAHKHRTSTVGQIDSYIAG
jgi:hypothetical protein